MDAKVLMEAAVEARKNAYAPYSGFSVGAALLAKNGKIYKGCNIENSAFSPTNCAERTAIFTAVAEGVTEFAAIAVVGGKGEELSDNTTPCGVCRQVMAEFCSSDFCLILGTPSTYRIMTLNELFPEAFSL